MLARLGRTPTFIVLDSAEQLHLLRTLLANAHIEGVGASAIHARITDWAERGLALGSVDLSESDIVSEAAAKLWDAYENAKRQANAFDFGDLINQPLALLEHDQALRARWAANIAHLLVDEAQDLNATQLRLIELLAGKGSLFIVGDVAQAVYGFQGARPEYVAALAARHNQAHIYELTTNYRSTPQICALANALVASAPDTGLPLISAAAVVDKGPVPIFRLSSDEEAEAFLLARDLYMRLEAGEAAGGMAVLVRTNAQIPTIERALASVGVPYRVLGGLGFWSRPAVRELMAWLRGAVNAYDGAAFRQLLSAPRRGIGPVLMSRLSAAAQSGWLDALNVAAAEDWGTGKAPQAISDTLRLLRQLGASQENAGTLARYALAHSGLFEHADQEQRDDWDALIALADRHAGSLADFVTAALSGAEPLGAAGQVSVTTIHGAKGREWRSVFIAGVEEGYLPTEEDDPARIAEERRLLYVGITRACYEINLSAAASRMVAGRREVRHRSRFIDDMATALLVAPTFIAHRARAANRRAPAEA